MKQYNLKYEDYVRIADFILNKIKLSARTAIEKGQKYGRKKRLSVEVDLEYLINLLKQTEAKCEITKIPFPICSDYKNEKTISKCFFPSPDRIDSNYGYIKGNIQIVCQAINIGKNKSTQEQYMEFVNEMFKANTGVELDRKIHIKDKTKQSKNKIEVMKKSEINNEFVKHLMNEVGIEYAVQYFEYNQNTNKENKVVKQNVEMNETPAQRRKKYTTEKAELIETPTNEMVELKVLLGAKDTDSMFAKKMYSVITENEIPIFKVKAERNGYKYYISNSYSNLLQNK